MNELLKFVVFFFSCHTERRGCSNCCHVITDRSGFFTVSDYLLEN